MSPSSQISGGLNVLKKATLAVLGLVLCTVAAATITSTPATSCWVAGSWWPQRTCKVEYNMEVCKRSFHTYNTQAECCKKRSGAFPLGCRCSCTDAGAMPVCGKDGITYDSACQADCSGVEVAFEGLCGPKCRCGGNVDPVCGKDGVTYRSACALDCARVELLAVGPCPADRKTTWVKGNRMECMCEGESSDPVCGADGKTYDNYCLAECARVTVKDYNACPAKCFCPKKKSDPVCGEDGKTYDSECEARCAGMAVVAPGSCNNRAISCKDVCAQRPRAPVCTSSGHAFDNECYAVCAGEQPQTHGPCRTRGGHGVQQNR